ncbi:MAG: hypothetical protein H6Q90_3257 [Deltaproteobacteria bacterium]|nr:hypothetical protein [Deltaproteobacteria bacterium]
MSLLAMLWCIAVLAKLAIVLARRRPYRFAQWDGGSLLRDRVLGATGSAVLAGATLVGGGYATYQLLRWMPYL